MTDRIPAAALRCYECKRAVGTADIAGAVDFTFGRFPLCCDCVDAPND